MTSEMIDFVARGAREISLRDLDRIVAALAELRERVAAIDAAEHPHLEAHYLFLADIVEDFAAGRMPELPYVAAAEAAFALDYLLKEVDVIPDFVPDVGLVDDATVAVVVLQRHEKEFRVHPKAGSVDWAALRG